MKASILNNRYTWFITGCAGFIGSNILEFLLKSNQVVIGIDNFSTGKISNLDDVKSKVGTEFWENFLFFECDIREIHSLQSVFENIQSEGIQVDFLVHQAAIGSVPRSIKDPLYTHTNNVDGFVNILEIVRENKIKKVVYASSSSVYGDEETLPKVENRIGVPLSPYAVSKYVNEVYATIYAATYNMDITGLRYFNVFGPRQDPQGAYAAVIPKWINSFINNKGISINGDGLTTRDFCYIDKVIQANILAAIKSQEANSAEVFNIAFGSQTSLNELAEFIIDCLKGLQIQSNFETKYCAFREGDIRHSLANIDKAKDCLGYKPEVDPKKGLMQAMQWYVFQNQK